LYLAKRVVVGKHSLLSCIRKGAFLKNVKYLNKLEAFVCGHNVLCTCFAALQPD